MSLVSVENLSVRYGANTVLSHVDMAVEPGEIVTIVGPNGSGKTSLLRAIIGATKPCAGHVSLKPGLKIGYVPQKLHVDPTLPNLGREIHAPDGSRFHVRQCVEALETAGVPDLLKRQMSQLSGGQFQRVLLARALINKPDVLLLDEADTGTGTSAVRRVSTSKSKLCAAKPDAPFS